MTSDGAFPRTVILRQFHAASGPPNAEVVSDGPDPNHFHPEYFGRGTRWHLPDLARSEAAYRLARAAFEADGRAVIDATLGGRLTIFPKADYRSLFALPKPETGISVSAAPQAGRRYKVSALVSTYNAEEFLRGLLEDLEAQTIADELEIIVVDSGSQQNEAAVVEEFQRRYDNIVYLRTERETLYAAWNRAIQVARGEYLTVANTDDRHRPDALERMARALDENPEVALVYADSLKTRQPNRPFGEAEVSGAFRWPDFDPNLLLRACYIGPQPMWRRELHERHGLFNPAYRSAGDYEFWLRLAHRGERFLHLPEPLGLYYDNPHRIEHSDQALNEAEAELVRARYWPAGRPRRPLRVSWQRDVGLNQPLLRPPAAPGRPVNICIVTYNRLDYTRRVFEALEHNPPGCPHVLTVVDNGSTDGTAEWLREQVAQGRIHNLYLLPENVGVSRAQNLAWATEPEMHYLKLDNDMVPQRPGWLLPMVLLAESLPEVGAVAYNVEPVSYPLTIRWGWPVRVKGQGNLGGACLLIPHRVHQKVGFWCEDYGLYGEEDADMGFRLRRLGLLNVYMPDEHAFFHLPSGRAARIDPVTLQAVGGDEDPAYRQHKDTWRRKNLRERQRLQRNLKAYHQDPDRCRVERALFDAAPFRVPSGPAPRPGGGSAAFDLERYTLEVAKRLHDDGDLDAAMVCFAWLGLIQSRRQASDARSEAPSVALYLSNEVSGEVRLGLAAEPLRRLGYRVHLASAFAPEDIERHDLFVFSRPHLNPAVYEGLKAVALRGKPLLVDLDDLFHAIPPDHPGYANVGPGNPVLLSLLESILQVATWLIVATPQLADFYGRWARGVTVIPNGWSAANLHWRIPRRRRETVTLGWAGTITHRQDVLLMRPAVMRVLRQHPHARLVIGGDPEVYRLFSGLPQERRRFVPWMPYREYPRLLAEFDILLAPLRDNAFNRAKSDIKLVEAGAAGIPWVASPLPAYKAWGVGGLFAETRRQWTKALGSLIADPALRQRLGEEGRRKAQEREAEALAREWASLFATLGYPPTGATERPSPAVPEDAAARLLAEVLESEDPLAALEARRDHLDQAFLALVVREAERARQEGEMELADGLEALAEVVQEMLAVPVQT